MQPEWISFTAHYALSDNSTERSDIPNSNTSMSNKDQMPIKSESSNSTVSVLIATPKLLGLEHSYYESVDLPSNKLNMYEDFERNVWTSVSAYIHSCSAEVEDLRVMMRVTYDENAPSIPSQMSVLMYSNDILDRVTVLNIEHKRNSNTSDIGRSVSSLSQAGWVWGDNSAPSSNDIRPVCSLPSEWNFTARNHLTLSSSNNSLSCRSDTVSCGSKTTCGQMANCEEAKNYFEQCGLTSLDGDSDGIPCDNLCI
ncbi:hypothetical protein OLMES_3157 [Oleiphilus messinensis]|uniref:Excalibur calcium-binding domain-containing protein n=1 Tax=Oleiphilus messinensis TaxID=141451 RepID=A0A1Y0IAL0_9GAMM|nr:hypothetical protein OLMES_3157 [Oleiphilus messinensis]